MQWPELVERLLEFWQPVRRDIAVLEAVAERAYDEMYDASSYRVKECYEDASTSLSEAIDLAARAKLTRIAERLTARREHIANVYNHQFRYAGR